MPSQKVARHYLVRPKCRASKTEDQLELTLQVVALPLVTWPECRKVTTTATMTTTLVMVTVLVVRS